MSCLSVSLSHSIFICSPELCTKERCFTKIAFLFCIEKPILFSDCNFSLLWRTTVVKNWKCISLKKNFLIFSPLYRQSCYINMRNQSIYIFNYQYYFFFYKNTIRTNEFFFLVNSVTDKKKPVGSNNLIKYMNFAYYL